MSCEGCGTIRTHEMEQLIYDNMVEKLREFKNLTAKRKDAPANPKLTAISGYSDDWENTSLDEKRQGTNSLITIIRATSENVKIEWKI